MANSSPPKSTSMLRKPLPLGKMHGRKIFIGTPITDAGFILSNGITSMSRGTILYMTVGTYGLANNAMESPQIFQSLAYGMYYFLVGNVFALF